MKPEIEKSDIGVNCISMFETAIAPGAWRLRPSSIAVYRSMWRKFVQQAQVRRIDVTRVTASELEDLVLQAYPDNTNTANKLFRVVFKVFEHCGPLAAAAHATAKSIEHRFFDKEPVTRTAFPSQPDAPAPLIEAGTSWKKLRTAALHALLDAAAPRTEELRALRYRDIAVAASALHLTLGRGSNKRTVVLPADTPAGAALASFHSIHPCPKPASAFFCAGPAGEALNAATLYRQVKARTESQALSPEHHGTGAFRAALAKRMHDEGRPLEDIRSALGHRLVASTEEFLKQIRAPGAPRKKL